MFATHRFSTISTFDNMTLNDMSVNSLPNKIQTFQKGKIKTQSLQEQKVKCHSLS